MLRIFLFGIFSLQCFAMALGQERGNGGFLLVCPGKPAAFLDYAEVRDTYVSGKDIVMSPAPAIALEKARWALQRFAGLEPVLAHRLREKLERFDSSIVWVNSFSENFETEDRSGDLDNISPCGLEQLIVQFHFPHTQFYIKKIAWDRLPENQKAMAMIHEVFYQDYLEQMILDPFVILNYKSIRMVTGLIVAYSEGIITASQYEQMKDLLFGGGGILP